MRYIRRGAALCAAAGVVVIMGAAAPEPKQVVTGPIAQYWVSASTNSGMSFGGAKPSMGDMMKMMGGGGNVSHALKLQLGSNAPLTGAEAQADHTPPQGLGTGVLPLYYKPPKPSGPVEQGPPPQEDKTYEPPKGRILIFWGCGEHSGPNQPIEIDLSKIMDPVARNDMISKMAAASVTLSGEKAPSPAGFKTYGEWPNEKSRKSIGPEASLIGAHSVAGNYSPDISFTLDQTQDFLVPVQVTSNQPLPSGAVGLGWRPVPQAKAYLASTIGGDQNTFVFWNSSGVQTGMMMMAAQYLTPADIQKLLTQKVLLPAQTTSCAVPAEVYQAAPHSLYTLTAFGGEANFAYPPRPADPKVAWNIQWTAKVRYRSATGGLLGQDTGVSDAAGQPKKKKGGLMGELLKGAIP